MSEMNLFLNEEICNNIIDIVCGYWFMISPHAQCEEHFKRWPLLELENVALFLRVILFFPDHGKTRAYFSRRTWWKPNNDLLRKTGTPYISPFLAPTSSFPPLLVEFFPKIAPDSVGVKRSTPWAGHLGGRLFPAGNFPQVQCAGATLGWRAFRRCDNKKWIRWWSRIISVKTFVCE